MTDEDYEIIHSPLERTLTGEGHTLRIAIYRGVDEPDWILEIEDDSGTSSVFDDRFATDQEALEVALAEIEAEGGIECFWENAQVEALREDAELAARRDALGKAASADSAVKTQDLFEPLTEEELDELDELLLEIETGEGMTLDSLDGFLHAIAIGPETVMPSQWLPKVWALDDAAMMPPMDTVAQANHLLGLIMRHYNSIIGCLRQSPPLFAPIWPTYAHTDGDIEDAEDWAYGFIAGVNLCRKAWQPLLDSPQGQQWYRPIELLGEENAPLEWHELTKTPQQRAALTAQIEASVLQMHAHWLPRRLAIFERQTAQRVGAKVGRNEICPCGSGKKFKKCCGAPGTLH